MASLTRNTFFSAVTNLSDLFQFALMIMAGRMLGAAGFGAFSFAHSIATVVLTFSDFGLNQLAIREVSRNREIAGKYLGNILTWRTVLALTSFIFLLFIVAFIMAVDKEVQLITAILGLAVMIRFFSLTGRCFLHAFERFDVETLAVAIEQVVLLVAGTVLLLTGYGVIGLAIAFFVARAIGCCVTFFLVHKIIPLHLQFDFSFIKKLQLEALPIGIALLVMTAYVHVDTVLLTNLRDFHEVGLYNSAFKVYSGLFMIPSIICTVFLPRLSTAFIDNKASFRKLLFIGSGILAAVALLVCGLGFFGAHYIIELVFGAEYNEAAPAMQFFFLVLFVTFQIWFLRIVLIAVNQQKVLMYFYLVALVIRIVADFLLIPVYGIMGAVGSTFICEIFLFLGIWIFLAMKVFFVFNDGKELIK